MPYITQEAKDALAQEGVVPSNAGELNFMLTMLCLEYVKKNGEMYSVYNDILGALTGCQFEFYRRQVTPYESIKSQVNGDVYYVKEKNDEKADLSGNPV